MSTLLHPVSLGLVKQGPEQLPAYHCGPNMGAFRPSERFNLLEGTLDRISGLQKRKM